MNRGLRNKLLYALLVIALAAAGFFFLAKGLAGSGVSAALPAFTGIALLLCCAVLIAIPAAG